ncbi:magnesium transporter [Hyaloraphidium curvatum]|nr:magnesium transporter [Hyaloraphidium curvatum]
MLVARGLTILGLLLLLHSGYSAIEHIAFLKATERFESVLPGDIVTECLVGMAISVAGVVMLATPLKPILLEIELARKTYDVLDNRLSFLPARTRALYLQ